MEDLRAVARELDGGQSPRTNLTSRINRRLSRVVGSWHLQVATRMGLAAAIAVDAETSVEMAVVTLKGRHRGLSL